MTKYFIIAAFIVASFSAKAQTSTKETVYIGIKCPTCPQRIIWDYERKGVLEILTNPDQTGYYEIDWLNETVKTTEGTFKIEKHQTPAFEPKTVIVFNQTILTIHYDRLGKYAGHTNE